MSTEPTPAGARRGKWLKTIAVVGLLVLAAAAGFAYYTWSSASAVPDYYARQRLSGDERLEAIASVERKFGNLQGSLGQALASQQTSQAAEAVEPIELTFEAAELDTYFEKWLEDNDYGEAFGKYMTDPRLLMNEGRLVLAGRATLPAVGQSVVSMHFLPSVGAEGNAQIELEAVYAGVVSLPDSAVQPMRDKAAQAIENRLPTYLESAAINDDGSANQAAVDLAIDRQLARILDDLPVEDFILFPPLLNRGPIATRVTAMTIEDGIMTLRLVPLTSEERLAYIEAIRADPTDAVDVDELVAG